MSVKVKPLRWVYRKHQGQLWDGVTSDGCEVALLYTTTHRHGSGFKRRWNVWLYFGGDERPPIKGLKTLTAAKVAGQAYWKRTIRRQLA